MDVLSLGVAVVDIMASPIPRQEDWKEKQRIREIGIHVGGDAANQAVRLADQGLSVGLCAALGQDGNGQMLTGLLQQRGVDTRYLHYREDISTGTALVLVGTGGERNIFSVKGAHATLTGADLPDLTGKAPRALSLASLFLMPELERDGLKEFLLQLKKQGTLIFADLGNDKQKLGLEGIRCFLPLLDYFLPSHYDARDMLGNLTPEQAACEYRRLGCKNVIIKCGEDGCYFASEDDCGWIPAFPVTPRDTTGAGDTMVALTISRILKGDTLRQALEFACKGASISTLYMGACDAKLDI